MSPRCPADIGMRLEDVETPALLVDLAALEENLGRMAASLAGRPVRLRPHAKSHKCPVIALRQIAHGAIGVCCQKVSEAEAMVRGGVADVYVSNEIVATAKLRRLAALARDARVAVAADNTANIDDLSAVARSFGVEFRVLVEIDVGMKRCGVAPGEPALALAVRIERAPGLRFGGLQAYHGPAQHLPTPAKRREAIEAAAAKVVESLAVLERHGIPCPEVSGAGTGTYRYEAASGVFTELQAGSYVFMDRDYGRIEGEDGQPFREFAHSLFVYATVMSVPGPDHVVVDAGTKALSTDKGMPGVHQLPGAEYVRASDEHGDLRLADPARPLRMGDKVRLIPGHCDPTVNLHDWYVGYRGDRVEALWPITGRGPGL